jgi:transposase InsO family protein
VIVIIDTFTRYVTLHAGKDASGGEAASAIHKHICTYGMPTSILTDNGSQFINEMILRMTELYGIEHETTTAYSKEENGLVERANKEVNRHLRDIIFDIEVKKEWAIYLPMVQRLINSSVHMVLGVSPHQLIFGNSIDLQRGLIPTLNQEIENRTQPFVLRSWVDDLLHKQQRIVRIAQQAQRKYNTKEINKRITSRGDNVPTSFPINSYVLVKYPPSKQGRGPPTKFHSFWRGPYKVESVTGDKYNLLNIVTGQTNTFHVTQLKEFVYNGNENVPLNIARKDDDEYIVESILDHRINFSPDQKGLYILVKWEGYNDPTWEPRKNFMHVEVFHDYCSANKLKRFIPKGHRKYQQQEDSEDDTSNNDE